MATPDMGGFTFEMPQQDYSYVMPQGGYNWEMPSWAMDFANQGYDFQPQGNDYKAYEGYSTPQQYGGWEGAGGWGAGAGQMPQQEQIFQESALPPGTGGPSGSSRGTQTAGAKDDNEWLKMLLKGGMGLGAGLIGSMGQGEQKKGSSLPPPPGGQTPPPPQMQPLPGTKASPLISGMPMQAQGSSGLNVQDRMRQRTGGFALY